MNLLIQERHDEADGVISLVLGHPDGAPLPAWEPGAHVDVTLPDGMIRQYSLCSDPSDRRRWRLGILREAPSRGGSDYIVNKLYPGDTVEVGAPRNNFVLTPSPRYVFVAGGIGITPILPMIARAERAGAGWELLYGGRNRATMAFVEELAHHRGHVTIAPQDEVGLLDIAGLLDEPRPDTLVYACGPEPLLDAVTARMGRWPTGSLNLERFTPKTIDLAGPDAAFEVEFVASGVTVTVPPGLSILTAAEDAGIPALWSCREGTCGSCETAIVSGRAEHRDSVLTEEEQAEHSAMMICVSRAEKGCPKLCLDR